MRTALYYRVSTKLQEDRYSLSAQRTELTNYANTQGWTIVKEFKDVDSGGKLDKQGLNALLDLVEEGRIDVVLCIDQDRLSRLDTIAWEYLKSTLRDNGVKIAEPGHIVDLSNEDEEFISDIKNLIAKREKKAIVRRMMRGKRQRMREGKGWGKAPIGYLFNKKTQEYEIDDKWSWVIPMIDDLYLNQQLGMKSIGDELNKISKTPSGTPWNETLVHRRLISKAFHGVMEKTFSNGETITLDDIYPPLRSKDTWEKIQKEREKRSKQFKATSRQRDDLHILRRTAVTCGDCGRKVMLSQHGTRKTPRYYLKHGRRVRMKDQSVCDISINTIRFENNIMQAIKEILLSEETARKYIDLNQDESEIKILEKQLKANESQLTKQQAKLDNLLDLFLDSPFSKERLTKKQFEIENEIDNIKQISQPLKAKLELLKNESWSYDLVLEALEAAENFETEFTPLQRAKMFGDLFPKAVLYTDRLMLLFNLKGAPLEIAIPIEPDPYVWHHTKKANI